VHEAAILLIEAGFSARELERRLTVAGLDPGALVGVAVTHEHGDHAKGATRIAARHGVPVASSMGTWNALARGGEPCSWLPASSRGPAMMGPFTIEACPSPHDAAEPVVLGVRCEDGPSVAIATDLGRPTQPIRWFLRDRDCLILESNYDDVLLRTSGYPAVVQQRIAGSGGHLSNSACAGLIEELHHTRLTTVVLAHLSQRCNTPDAALATVKPILDRLGFAGQLCVATQEGPMPPVPLGDFPQATLP
jgi:phosphoribosyl 1,2-cyclic phosphodiesterase